MSPITTPPAPGFYLPGEGQGGVQIDAVNLQTGAVSSTQTWSSGGYELSLAPGQYRIIASLNDTVIQTCNVTVNNLNIEQDFVLTNTWQGGTPEAAIAAAQPQIAPAVVTPAAPPATTPATVVGTLANVVTSSQPSSPHVSTPSATSSNPLLALFANSWCGLERGLSNV